MGDLIRVFERFLGRDLVYILAGAIPLMCLGRILWAEGYLSEIKCISDVTSLEKVYWVWIALAVGVAYVLGYLMQESFCLTPLSSTAIEKNPRPKCVQRLFKWSQGRDWKDVTFDGEKGELLAQIRLQHSEKSAFGEHAERMTYLMQVGTALGPACIVGSSLLLVWWLIRSGSNQNVDTFDWIVGAALLITGVSFLMLGALKRAQLREYIFQVDEWLRFSHKSPRSQE